MSSQDLERAREGRSSAKLGSYARASSVQYPERLKGGEDWNEDAAAVRGNPGQSVNQSVFAMITRGGSTTDFHKRFNDESSESEDEPPYQANIEPSLVGESQITSRANANLHQEISHGTRPASKLSEAPVLAVESVEDDDPMSRSMLLPPQSVAMSKENEKSQAAPVLSQMLDARAELAAPKRSADREQPKSRTSSSDDLGVERKSLSEQLKEIFGFGELEDVLAGAYV